MNNRNLRLDSLVPQMLQLLRMYKKRWMQQRQESKEFVQGLKLLKRRIHSIKTVVQFAPKIPNVEKQFLIHLLNQSLTEYERVLEK